MTVPRVIIIGAGAAGLSAALALTARGLDVTVLERAATVGGKMREAVVGEQRIDCGPTVFTMRWVFDELFDTIGESVDRHLTLEPLSILARHAWRGGGRLDLFADETATEDAIGRFAGRHDAAGYRAFCRDAKKIFDVLKLPFICAPAPSMTMLMKSAGFRDLTAIKPFQSMWKALAGYFADERLRQLFGRYATYCGSSPFHAPATLMLVAHVESAGVWSVKGGMHQLARTLAGLAEQRGARIRTGCEVARILTRGGQVTGVTLANGEQFAADVVIATADVAALAAGLFGSDAAKASSRIPDATRSLSAMTFSGVTRTRGFPLLRHSVFFSRDYPAEFDSLVGARQMPLEPTVYVCAQDRTDAAADSDDPERLFVLINAPANGDRHRFDDREIGQCAQRTSEMLGACGLELGTPLEAMQVTTPSNFNQLFPATGGALYGRSSHGWTASFQRPGARTKLPGLYLAGGSAHPGPGVPMAALSGRMAAASAMADLGFTATSRRTGMPGGMSTR